MQSKRKSGSHIRLLMSDPDVRWLVYSYALIGFLNGNETNVVIAILREVNESPDEICEVKRDILEKYTRLSTSELKRNLTSLKNLGILSSMPTKNGAVRYFNRNALEVLQKVYRGGNKMSIYHLRNEMDRLGIKSLLDVDDELLKIVFSLSGEKLIKSDSDGSNMGHPTSQNTVLQRNFEKSAITVDELRAQYHMKQTRKSNKNTI